MTLKHKDIEKLFRVPSNGRVRLKDWDPQWAGGDQFRELKKDELKARAETFLKANLEELAAAQEVLWATDRHSVLIVLQAMDGAGKDGTIKHVMSGVNPQGCQIFSFKRPSEEDLDHTFLWRYMKALPERGRIGIFNRSYYEETLVTRVHPEILGNQKLPPELVSKKRIWDERYEDINAFERYLSRQGVVILKFFLHVSKDEQKRRFLSRLEEPAKNWKFSIGDAHERGHWQDYQDAYEDTIRHTASKHAPWYVVPADHKWFTRIVVAAAVIDALQDLKLEFPEVNAEKRKELAAVRQTLEAEK